MSISFEGSGQWAVTFLYEDVEEGEVVKLNSTGKAVSCAAGDAFCGVVLTVGRDGGACATALGGMVKTAFSGTAPTLGWAGLSADGKGGVKADSDGRSYLVVAADGKTVTFVL